MLWPAAVKYQTHFLHSALALSVVWSTHQGVGVMLVDKMIRSPRYSHGLELVDRAAKALRIDGRMAGQVDPVVARYVAGVSVWGRWFVIVVTLFQFAYRPGFWYYEDPFEYTLLLVPLVAFNGLVHYRLLAKGEVTWRWLLFLSAMDIALATVGVIIQGGFAKGFVFLAYYPALVVFVLVFSSLWLGLAWTTMTAGVYSLVCLEVGPGLDLVAGDEKELLVRVAAMYVTVLCVGLVSRFEQARRQAAEEREMRLQRDRVEFSRAVHDTTAQTAYVIGLGVDRAKAQAGDANPELNATLEELSRLSTYAIWELRHPVNVGGIYEGNELGPTLRSHAASFTNITSVPAEMTQTGLEPPLSEEDRGLLFSIAHNALTNAYRHAGAGRVSVHLEFGADEIRLSVSDDGTGLPDDYAERGHGFENMYTQSTRLGGRLVVEKSGAMGGASVTCVVPAERRSE